MLIKSLVCKATLLRVQTVVLMKINTQVYKKICVSWIKVAIPQVFLHAETEFSIKKTFHILANLNFYFQFAIFCQIFMF